MVNLYNNIKAFILADVNDRIEELSTEEIPLSKIQSKNIVFGSVDPLKYTANIVCAIVPDSQRNGDEELGGYVVASQFTIAFLCRGAKSETLAKQICNYAKAFRDAVDNDTSLIDTVETSDLGEFNFYMDAGPIEGQLSAVEISFTVYEDEED